MLDLFDQNTSSYVVFAYPQKNVSEGRARARIFENAIDLACLMHHYGGGTHSNIYSHTLPLFLLTMLIYNARICIDIASGLTYVMDGPAPRCSLAPEWVDEALWSGSDDNH